MKKLLMVSLILSCLTLGIAFAADNYYVSGTMGNDVWSGKCDNPPEQGSDCGPWQSIDRVNNSYFQPGDTIHFRCGDTWHEQLNIPSSGAEGIPITFTGYGAECNDNNKPVIDASDVIPGWSQYSGYIYVADVQLYRASENLIENNTFDVNASLWSEWPRGMSDNALKSFSSSCDIGIGGSGGGCIIFTSSRSYPDNHLSSNAFSLESGKYYTVKFRVAVVNNVQVTVNVIRGESPWDNSGFSESFTADASGDERSFTFQATSTLSNAILLFYLPPGQEVIRIDDVSVKTVSPGSGAVKQLFMVNPSFSGGQYLKLAEYTSNNNGGFFIIDETTVSSDKTYLIDNELSLIAGRDINGAGVYIKTQPWHLENRQASSLDVIDDESGSKYKISWTTPAMYTPTAGFGYYLDNKLWMLDKPGEWYYDQDAKKLYVWLPDSGNPNALGQNNEPLYRIEASNRDFGIKALLRQYVSISGVHIKNAASTGIFFDSTKSFKVADSYILHSGHDGLYAFNSYPGDIRRNFIDNSVNEGINIYNTAVYNRTLTPDDAVSVIENTVRNTGSVGSPKSSLAAITVFTDYALIEKNTVEDSGYLGISYMRETDVINNVVKRSCKTLDDCGGIYTWNGWVGDTRSIPFNSSVIGNIVIDTIGNVDGVNYPTPNAQGIYLDDFSRGIQVLNNTIVNASRYGIYLHNASYNEVRDNTSYDSGEALLSMFECCNEEDVRGKQKRNTITGNILFPTASSKPVYLFGGYDNIDFGAFDSNIYSIVYGSDIVFEKYRPDYGSNPGYWPPEISYDLSDWQQQRRRDKDGNLAYMDVNAGLFYPFSLFPDRVLSIDPNNNIANGSFDTTDAPWGHSSSNGDAARVREPNCNVTGGCLKFTSGPTSGDNHLSSNTFQVELDKTYMVEFKVRADQPVNNMQFLVRKPSTNWRALGLADYVDVGTTWYNVRRVFKATETLDARLDLYLLPGDGSIYIDDVRIHEAASESNNPADDSKILINESGDAATIYCPDNDPVRCNEYVYIDGDDADQDGDIAEDVIWPLAMGPYSSKIIVWAANPYADRDFDGIPDTEDNCPNQADAFQTDADSDGYGAACDCDDSDAAIYSGAFDNDADGYFTCDDCDDNNVAVNPGAHETMNNGFDDDCNPNTPDVSSFSDDFNSGTSSEWITVSGDWEAETGGYYGYSGVDSGNPLSVTVVDISATTSNMVIEVDYYSLTSGNALNGFIIFDYDSATGFFKYAGARDGADYWTLGYYNGAWNNLGTYDEDIVTERWYRMRVTINGTTVSLGVDDDRDESGYINKVTYTFSSIGNGKTGLARVNSHAWFDNFIVYYDADGDGVTSDVDCNDSDASIYPGGQPVRVTETAINYYPTIQSAYDISPDGSAIEINNVTLTENLDFNLNKTLMLAGGYDCGYSTVTGMTIISGNVTISDGKVTIENLELH